jgi:hypothetical protein
VLALRPTLIVPALGRAWMLGGILSPGRRGRPWGQPDQLLALVHAQYDDGGPWILAQQPLRGVDSRDPRDVDVHQHDVRPQANDALQSILRLKNRSQAHPEVILVIDDEHAHAHDLSHRPSGQPGLEFPHRAAPSHVEAMRQESLALDAGASSYVLKDASLEEILSAIQAAAVDASATLGVRRISNLEPLSGSGDWGRSTCERYPRHRKAGAPGCGNGGVAVRADRAEGRAVTVPTRREARYVTYARASCARLALTLGPRRSRIAPDP